MPRSLGINAAICTFLVVAVALVFLQTAGYEFVNFDDNNYVYANRYVRQGLTFSGLERAFTRGDASNWHPLTWISHMIDCQIFHLWAGGHHLTNVAIHATVAVGLFLTLLQMTGSRWPSAAVAAIFAIHPLRVESVAWVAERKDVLSGLFFVLTLSAYVSYVRHGETWLRGLFVWSLYLVGLMCKPMLVTLPVVLLLLDYWPLKRLGSKAFGASPRRWAWNPVVEKIPLLILSLMSCCLTVIVQKQVLIATNLFSWPMRLENAAMSYVVYLRQTLWPTRLAALYPYPWESLGLGAALGAITLLVFISAIAVMQWRRRPYLLVGWLWYLVMLLPVIGLVQVGLQSHADRYTYLPLVGPCLAVVWFVAEELRRHRGFRWAATISTCIVLALLMTTAWHQTTTWRDSTSLWTHALDLGYASDCAHNNLADLCCEKGQYPLALKHYQEAIRLFPYSVQPHVSLGMCLVNCGLVEEGIAQYRMALDLYPNNAVAETDLGRALASQNKLGEAVGHFQRALEIDPENSWACYQLGGALQRQGRLDDAIEAFERSLRLNPNLALASNDLANIFRQLRRFDDSLAHYRRAVEIDPDFAEAYNNLALLLDELGRRSEAAEQFRKALEINPRYVQAHNNYGVLLMNQGMLPEAIVHFRTAIALDPKFDLSHGNLANALGRQGQNAEAAAEMQTYLQLRGNP